MTRAAPSREMPNALTIRPHFDQLARVSSARRTTADLGKLHRGTETISSGRSGPVLPLAR